jgi:hypothetical protein
LEISVTHAILAAGVFDHTITIDTGTGRDALLDRAGACISVN